MKHWGVTLGGLVFAWEVYALRTGRHTWTDHMEDGDLVTALPVLVFTGWIVQHLARAFVGGPTHPHRHKW